nr:hypothetical protein [Tanacetum cinerariifolium]
MIIKKYYKIVKAKGERKSLALKAKKESSDKECLTFRSEDEEYAMTVREFKKFFKRRGSEVDDEKAKDETCLVAQASNELAKDGLARGIPRLKFQKDHLCSACALGKSKKSSHQPKAEHMNQEKLYLLHMDLCDPMRMVSINRKSLRWTKDHPIANVIGDPSRSNFKQAMPEPSWIDAMQEEIYEFKRLQVWELVSCLDKVLLIKLKWIYKVKTDEFGEILKNKARLVAQGFRQEEIINFEESFARVARIGAIYILIRI